MKRLAYLILLLFPIICFGQGMNPVGSCVTYSSSCTTQTTPNDMETNAYTYTEIALTSTLKYVASKFVADASTGTVCKVCLRLNKIGSPTMNFSVAIWGDTSGRPNPSDVKASYGSMNAGSINESDWNCFSSGSASLSNGTAYHIVITASATDESNYFRWIKDATCATEVIARSSDGSTWYDLDTSNCDMARLYK